jgi:GTP cyclohydrolase I
MASDDASHVAALAVSLERLQVQRPTTTEQSEEKGLIQDSKRSVSVPRSPISKDGYGFRRSGVSTPLVDGGPHSHLAQELLVPDLDGLGWPGAFLSLS